MHVKTEYKHTSPDDRAYYPIIADIQNHIYTAKKGMDFSKLDQENLQKKIQQWDKDLPSSTQYFRPYIDTEEDSKALSLCFGYLRKSGRSRFLAAPGGSHMGKPWPLEKPLEMQIALLHCSHKVGRVP